MNKYRGKIESNAKCQSRSGQPTCKLDRQLKRDKTIDGTIEVDMIL